ncbi:terminase [Caulobacter vibrioides]|uniref:Terminase n=1 Tax=Caulobacter vibrioides TaxID=155892 RepID=A0A290MYM7_CAUVI|nr:terminase gpA endonuclease subunit [Caulobacter vibrioides]ATC34098.1 terminase [Caulobacter vibrioides]
MNAETFLMPSPYAAEVLGANAVRINHAFASGLRPPPRLSVAEWAERYREFPDDAPLPGPWVHSNAPYLVEIMEALSPHDPCSEIDIMKCAQSGGSASGENWIGYISDVAPGPLMYVQATITAAKDWLAEKFWPMVESTRRLNPEKGGTVMPKGARKGDGSTSLRVRFRRGGWMLIAGANSAATLRQHSIRYVIEDDLDQFPDNLDNQGSPEGMITARLRTYARQGISKRLGISTPTIKGGSKIGKRYRASDQRRFYLKCRHCGSRFDPVFSDLRWPDGRPDLVELVAPCCGVATAHWEKALMSLADGWIPTVEINGEKPPRVMAEQEVAYWKARDLQGRRRGYHITGLISAFMTWAQLAVGFVEAQGDVNKLKTWTNLDMGDEFEVKGDAPPAEELEILREQDWGDGQVPWGPSIFTLGVDVQGDGLYFEGLGWAYGLENWGLGKGFLPGPTDVPGEGAWALLETVATRTFVMPGGKAYGFDQICVDGGYNTEAAKAFCRRSPKRLVVFGRPGWSMPILGRGQAIAFELGRNYRRKARKKAGDDAHLVGTFGAKLSFYGALRVSIEYAKSGGKGPKPRGLVHFGRDATPDYFDMLTAESVVTEKVGGETRRVWKVDAGRQNHWLDCRVYNRAAAEALALDNLSEADWLAGQAQRYAAADPNQGDLVSMMNRPLSESAASSAAPETSAAAVAAGAAAAEVPNQDPDDDWIDNRDWSF